MSNILKKIFFIILCTSITSLIKSMDLFKIAIPYTNEEILNRIKNQAPEDFSKLVICLKIIEIKKYIAVYCKHEQEDGTFPIPNSDNQDLFYVKIGHFQLLEQVHADLEWNYYRLTDSEPILLNINFWDQSREERRKWLGKPSKLLAYAIISPTGVQKNYYLDLNVYPIYNIEILLFSEFK